MLNLDVPLADLTNRRTLTFPTGGIDLRAFMRRLPVRDFARDLSIDHTDTAPPRGACHAYWIRVTEEDGVHSVSVCAAKAGSGRRRSMPASHSMRRRFGHEAAIQLEGGASRAPSRDRVAMCSSWLRLISFASSHHVCA